jgi:hypothetical protein
MAPLESLHSMGLNYSTEPKNCRNGAGSAALFL